MKVFPKVKVGLTFFLKGQLVTLASHIGALVPVLDVPLPTQLLADVPGEAALHGLSA